MGKNHLGSMMPLAKKWRRRVDFLEHFPLSNLQSSLPKTSVKSTPYPAVRTTSLPYPTTTKTISHIKQRSLAAISSLSQMFPAAKSNPVQIELRSTMAKFLATSQWQAVDTETARAMLKIGHWEQEEWLYPENIQKFLCKDLQTIDRFRFGETITQLMQGKLPKRQPISQKLDRTHAANIRVWETFGEAVGWRENGE